MAIQNNINKDKFYTSENPVGSFQDPKKVENLNEKISSFTADKFSPPPPTQQPITHTASLIDDGNSSLKFAFLALTAIAGLALLYILGRNKNSSHSPPKARPQQAQTSEPAAPISAPSNPKPPTSSSSSAATPDPVAAQAAHETLSSSSTGLPTPASSINISLSSEPPPKALQPLLKYIENIPENEVQKVKEELKKLTPAELKDLLSRNNEKGTNALLAHSLIIPVLIEHSRDSTTVARCCRYRMEKAIPSFICNRQLKLIKL